MDATNLNMSDNGNGESSKDEGKFLSHQSVNDFIKDVMRSVKECQRLSTELQGWHHYKDYPAVQPAMEQVNDKLVSVITSIFSHSDIKLKLSDINLSDQFDMIKEGNDALLERTNNAIDDAAGLKKQPALQFIDSSIKTVKKPLDKSGKQVVLIAAKNIQKPQLFFNEKVNNSKKEPFIPILKDKPNSLKPLSIITSIDDRGTEYIEHPYKYELEHWSPQECQLQSCTVTDSLNMDHTPLTKVETEHKLEAMINKLKTCSEFAVDLEHHSFRSYQGLTCLIQISTRSEDYIVDTLALRGRLCSLNEVFTDPKIVKVFHGADYDILWLQRDCGVYVVNMFDTHQAAMILDYPQRSLAALLHHFCNIEANKVYQRADWRTRPLPIDFIDYARQDTHYLLYMYDKLRNELINKGNNLNNLLDAIYNRSTEICLKRYEKPHVDEESYLYLYRRSRKSFNNRQIYALQKLFIWRDNVARDHDESVDFVLPKHMLLHIAEVLPKEMQGILACCNPIPPLVKTELLTLHNIIRSAREQSLTKDNQNDTQIASLVLEAHEELTNTCITRHDLSQVEENVTGLPCLLDHQQSTLFGDLFSEDKAVKASKVSLLFGCVKNKFKVSRNCNIKTDNFMSPYHRYLAFQDIKPILDGGKNRKLQTGDVERLNRVREHLKHVSSYSLNTSNTQEDNSHKTDSSQPAEASQFEQDKDDRINGLFQYLKNLHKPQGESFTPEVLKLDSSEVNNDDEAPVSEEGAITTSEQIKKDEFKLKKLAKKAALRQMKKEKFEPKILADEIKKQRKKKKTKQTSEFAPQLLGECIASVTETLKKDKKSVSDDNTKSNLAILNENDNDTEFKPKKNKKRVTATSDDGNTESTSNNPAILNEDNNCEVKKSKKKRVAATSDDETSDKAIEKDNDSTLTNQSPFSIEGSDTQLKHKKKKKNITTDITDEEKIKSNKRKSSEDFTNAMKKQKENDDMDETEAQEAINYESADYSIFEKKKEAKSKQKKVHEKFKGTNQKGKSFTKSSMKCFTWGGNSKKK